MKQQDIAKSIKYLFILVLLNLVQGSLKAQTNAKDLFFKKHVPYLLDNEGTWECENPSYQKETKYSAKTFRYVFEKGVHGENLVLNIYSDLNDVGWFTSWKAYYLWHPQKKQLIYHAIGGDGSIADGVVYAPDSITLVNVFEVSTYNGNNSTHKDISIIKNKDKMYSQSYSLNKKGEWVLLQELTFRRSLNGK